MRHPLLGACVAIDRVPEGTRHKDAIVALVEEHDTAYSWYRQFVRTGAVPGEKAWAKLGRKIWSREEYFGVLLLALFKLADVDGHEDVADAVWFVEQATARIFRRHGRWMPVPSAADLQVSERLG